MIGHQSRKLSRRSRRNRSEGKRCTRWLSGPTIGIAYIPDGPCILPTTDLVGQGHLDIHPGAHTYQAM
eukprot:7058195-Heterocapsa_arctica.AAC.1